jgi:hypothetical protein
MAPPKAQQALIVVPSSVHEELVELMGQAVLTMVRSKVI